MPECSWRERWLPWLLLLAAAYLLYGGTFANQWTYDDTLVIVNNPDIRSLANFIENHNPGRPLRELTYLVDYRLFGLTPAGYHLQNIGWHALNAILLFLLALRCGGGRAVAWGAALLFLVHPVNVEVVANISHRKDSLALAFSLAALLCYGRFLDRLPRRWPWLAAAAAALGLALLAKQNALVLPAVFLAYEFAFVPPELQLLARHRRLLLGLALAGMVALVGWYVHLLTDPGFAEEVRRAMIKMESYGDWRLAAYFRLVLKSWSFSLGKFFLPLDLSPEYTFAAPAGWLDPWIGTTLLVIAGVGWLGWRSFRRRPLVFFALAWTMLFWLPTSNIAGHVAYFAADRYLYAPGAGLCLLLAAPLAGLTGKPALFARGVLVAVVLALVPLTWQQSRVWQSTRTLYTHVLQVNPRSLVGLAGRATDLLERGEPDRALPLFLEAVRRAPTDAQVLTNIGYIYYLRGEPAVAVGYFQRAIQAKPDYLEAYNNLGSAYDDLGRGAEAVAALQKALQLNPHYEKAYTNLGILYERRGDLAEAERMHRRALAELPEYGEAHYDLGVILFREGKLAEAASEFAAAVRLMPTSADPLLNLGITRLKLGDRAGAAALVPALTMLDRQAAARLTAALAEQGR